MPPLAHLLPCPDCARHLRRVEVACPFCGAAVDFSGEPLPRVLRLRLKRAAQLALGAALGSNVLLACSGGGMAHYGAPGDPNTVRDASADQDFFLDVGSMPDTAGDATESGETGDAGAADASDEGTLDAAGD